MEKIKKVQEEVEIVLRKMQEKIKRHVNKEKKKIEEQKKDNKVTLSIKDLKKDQ